jgi:hypothetical protein
MRRGKMISDISHGHVDLADVLFLLAFVVACFGIVMTVVVKPTNLLHLAGWLLAAFLTLAWFVL